MNKLYCLFLTILSISLYFQNVVQMFIIIIILMIKNEKEYNGNNIELFIINLMFSYINTYSYWK